MCGVCVCGCVCVCDGCLATVFKIQSTSTQGWGHNHLLICIMLTDCVCCSDGEIFLSHIYKRLIEKYLPNNHKLTTGTI